MSRASIVAMLVAAEVLIVGIAIYVVGGAGWHGLHRLDFTAVPIAPVAAGDAPHVVVDDPDSRVEVAVSADGLVHAQDLTQVQGAGFSTGPIGHLTMTRTADGVHIARPGSSGVHLGIFGFSRERIEIAIPSGSHLDVARCSGADVNGVEGGVSVVSQDGHITLRALRGTVQARSDDGYIAADGVHGDGLTMQSSDGHLSMSNVNVKSLVAHTADGHIEAHQLALAGGEISTNDGSIELGLAPGADLTVAASTGDGRIVVDGSRYRSNDEGDSVQHSIQVGSGAGKLRLSTADGSIHISTNGAQ